jgi:hypothetical protein
MAGAQAAGAGNAVGLERADRRGEGFNAEKMRAVGSGARGELRMAVEQERDIATLTTAVTDLARFISARSSAGSRRSSRAAMSPASKTGPRSRRKDAGSPSCGVTR